MATIEMNQTLLDGRIIGLGRPANQLAPLLTGCPAWNRASRAHFLIRDLDPSQQYHIDVLLLGTFVLGVVQVAPPTPITWTVTPITPDANGTICTTLPWNIVPAHLITPTGARNVSVLVRRQVGAGNAASKDYPFIVAGDPPPGYENSCPPWPMSC